MIRPWYVIDIDGAQIGVVHAANEADALDHAIDFITNVDDLDHVHEAGTARDPCQLCELIRRSVAKDIKH